MAMRKVLFAVLALAAAGEASWAYAQPTEGQIVLGVNDTSVPNPEYIANWVDPHWDRSVDFDEGSETPINRRYGAFGLIMWGFAQGVINARFVTVEAGAVAWEESLAGDTRVDAATSGYLVQTWRHAGVGGRVDVGQSRCSVRPRLELYNARASGQVALAVSFYVSCPPVDTKATINLANSTAGGEVFVAMTIPINGIQVPLPLVNFGSGEGPYTDIADGAGDAVSATNPVGSPVTVRLSTYSRIIAIADGDALLPGDVGEMDSCGFGATRATIMFGHE
jgi:hypothetical protein